MTTAVQTDPRRASRGGSRKPGRSPLEMPVLFQLADLSLQKSRQPQVTAPAQLSEPVEQVREEIAVSCPAGSAIGTSSEAPSVLTHSPVQEPKTDAPLPTVALEIAPQPAAELKTETALEPATPIAPPAEPPTAEAPPTLLVEEKTPVAEPTAPTVVAETQPSPTDITPPAGPTPPSPRERAEQRTKTRTPAPAKNDWMRTHGKFIAVGFVFALIATIYMAQNGDEPSPVPGAGSSSGETENQIAGDSETPVSDAHAAREAPPISEHPHSPSLLSESSPAAGNPAAHTELHPPTHGSDAKEASQPAEVADSKSLFPWKDEGETRVATKLEEKRSETPAESQPAESNLDERSPAQQPVEETPSVYGPPSSQPSGAAPHEPAATEPAARENSPPAGAGGYPVTSPNRYRKFEPPQNRPPQPKGAAPRATPANYQVEPTNNDSLPRTSGPRYERTGSGLY